jgi:Transglycosylase SLT domain
MSNVPNEPSDSPYEPIQDSGPGEIGTGVHDAIEDATGEVISNATGQGSDEMTGPEPEPEPEPAPDPPPDHGGGGGHDPAPEPPPEPAPPPAPAPPPQPAPSPAPSPSPAPGQGSNHNEGEELLRDLQATAAAFEKGDWLGGAMGVAKVAMDVLDIVGDPLGAISSAGFGWVLGAVSFLREPFDVLKGNSGSVTSSAQSFGESGLSLFDTADQFRQAATDQTRSWTGVAADGYRAASTNQANGLAALGQANQAVANAMQQGGQAVAQARQTVMDLISEAVQKIIQICIEALSKSWLSFGASIAMGIAQSVQQAVSTGQKLMQEIQSLIQTLQKIIQVIQKVVQIAQQVKELVELIGGKASAERPHTMSTQEITSTGAMATDTNPTGGDVLAAAQRTISPGYQFRDPAVASGGAGTAPTRAAAAGRVHEAPPAAGSGGTGGIAAPADQQVTAAQSHAPPMAGGGGIAAPAGQAPVGGAVAPPPVAAGGVAPAPPPVAPPAPRPAGGPPPSLPPGVPSWGPTGPPPDKGLAAGQQQVRAWVEEARQILIQQGVDPGLMNADQMVGLIQHESSGNPHAINLWDSNATAGHPSKGLMQTIDSTFSEHHLPGHDDIWNPVDNILAGTRYAIDRYGSISDVPGVRAVQGGGSYVGY